MSNKPSLSKKIARTTVNVVSYGVVFILIYSVVNWWRQPVSPANPQLQFTSIDKQVVDLNTLSQNKPVMVYFWGSWCGVCRQTSPSIHKFAQSSGYPVMTVAVNSGDDNEVKNYLAKHQWQFVTVNDEDGDIFADWQGQVTPSFIILKNGKMVQGLTGFHPAWELNLRMWLLDKF